MKKHAKGAIPETQNETGPLPPSPTKLLTALIAVALTASIALALVGCGSNNAGGQTDSSGNAQIANPMVEVDDVTVVNEQLDINLVVPQDATIESSTIIDNTLGAVVFTLENQVYTHRGSHTTESEDISGLYFDFSSFEEGTIGNSAYIIEYNEDGPGYTRWFDEAAGITYSVSVDTGATKDKLINIANLLVTEQNEAGQKVQ